MSTYSLSEIIAVDPGTVRHPYLAIAQKIIDRADIHATFVTDNEGNRTIRVVAYAELVLLAHDIVEIVDPEHENPSKTEQQLLARIATHFDQRTAGDTPTPSERPARLLASAIREAQIAEARNDHHPFHFDQPSPINPLPFD